MATKFSDFTAQAATGTTFVVGYDGTTNTQYSQDNLTNFVLDGTLTGNRNVDLSTYNLQFTNGKVGIGASSPLYTLDTKGTVADNWLARVQNDSGTGYGLQVKVDSSSSGKVTFATKNSVGYTMTVHNNGNVAIGKNSLTGPSARLHIKGSGTASTTSFLVENSSGVDSVKVIDDGQIKLGTTTGTNNLLNQEPLQIDSASGSVTNYIRKSGGSWRILNFTGGEPYMTVTGSSAANVTFGTGEVLVNSTNGVHYRYGAAASAPAFSGLSVTDNSASSAYPAKAFQNARITSTRIADKITNNGIGAASGGLQVFDTTTKKLQYWNETAWVELGGGDNIYTADGTLSGNRDVDLATNNLSFTNGEVGIGTTTFTNVGTGISGLEISDSTSGSILLRNDADDHASYWYNHSTGTYFGTKTNDKLNILQNDTVRMNISTDGNLAIGQTTTAASARLHIKGSGLTNATTALLVEDSSGNDIIKALDDRTVRLGYNANQITTESSNGGKVRLNNITGDPLFSASIVSGSTGKINVYGGYYNTFEYAASKGLVFTNEAGYHVTQDTSSMLTCVSSTKGFLPPRMTTTQRDAINSGTFTTGLTLYNTTDNKLQFYNGSAWTDAAGSADTNIYNTDGTLSGNRAVTLGNNTLSFTTSGNGAVKLDSPVSVSRNPSLGVSMYIQGQGATSSTRSLLLENSNGNYMMSVRDDGAITLGSGATLFDEDSNGVQDVVIGYGASTDYASTYYSNQRRVAIGYNADVNGGGGIAIGQDATVNSTESVAIGYSAQTTALRATAVGYDTSASTRGIAIGDRASTTGPNSVAVGGTQNATTGYGVHVGVGGSAGIASVSVGADSVSGTNATSIGRGASSTGIGAFTAGASVTNSGAYSFAFGGFTYGSSGATNTDSNSVKFYMNTTTPQLNFHLDNNSWWDSSSNFGFGDGNTSPTATVDIDGTFRLRSASNVSGKVLTADSNGNGTWQTAGGGSAGQNLLAITSITGSGGSQVQHDVKVYSNTTSNNFAAINFNSDETARFAKIVFTPTGTVAKVIFRALGKDVGGTGDTWLGLHSSSSQTASPAYGWFLVNKDAENGEYEHITAEWLLTGLTANQQITAYVMGIASLSGCTFYARELNTGAWNSTGDTTAFPATVEAYDVSVTITSNPSS